MWGGFLRWLLFSAFSIVVSAEGSRNLFPPSTKVCSSFDDEGSCRVYLEWTKETYGPIGDHIVRRTLFYVYAEVGEVILMGSSAVGVSLGDVVLYAPGLVAEPRGREVIPASPTFTCRTMQTGRGTIESREQELQGPRSPLGGGAGYIPCYYNVTTSGIHHVAFYGPSGRDSVAHFWNLDGQLNMTNETNWNEYQGSAVSAWDITVRASPNSNINIDGRVFTFVLSLAAFEQSRPTYFDLYPATKDGHVYRVSTAGLDSPFWVLYGSSRGFRDQDDTPLYHDVRGRDDLFRTFSTVPDTDIGPKFAYPDIPHFLSYPPHPMALKALDIPAAPEAPTTFSISVPPIIQANQTLTMVVDVANKPYHLVFTDSHPVIPRTRRINGMSTASIQSLTWDGMDDRNTPIPPGTYMDVTATIHEGEYHCILLNVVSNVGGGPIVQLLNANCPPLQGGCLGAFFDDLGYRLKSGAVVGEPGGGLCGGPDGSRRSDPIFGFDTRTGARAFGLGEGLPRTGQDCYSAQAFGDAKGLDLWTYTPNSQQHNVMYAGGRPLKTFQSKWRTTTANEPITLPLTMLTYDVTIQWGDGGSQVATSGYPTHVFGAPGEYNIVITGLVPGFSFVDSQHMAHKILSIESWGGFTVDAKSQFVFANCTNLADIGAKDQPKLRLNADLTGFFYNCSSLSLPPPNEINWDLLNAVSIKAMFAFATNFNSPVNFYSPFVTDTSFMFAYAQNFNKRLILNTSQVRTMERMFFHAESFNQPIPFNTENVMSMRGMFENAVSYNQPIYFITNNVTTMSRMFSGAKSYNFTLSFNSFLVKDMSRMFYEALAFNSHLSLSTSAVRDMQSMFQGAASFNKRLDFNTNKATDMSFMFADAISFNQNVSFKFDNVVTTAFMFANATSFNARVNCSNNTLQSVEGMFQDATSFNSSVIMGAATISNMRAMFLRATSFNQELQIHPTSSVSDMSSMFENATSYNQPTTLQTGNVLNMSRMFKGATSFDQPLNFETVNIQDVTEMFAGTTLTTEKYANWTTNSMMMCDGFCDYCALPKFQLCQPCDPILISLNGYDVCNCPPDQLPIRANKKSCVYQCLLPTTGDRPCLCPIGLTPITSPAIGCVPIRCDAAGYRGSPGNCTCAVGYAGTVQYTENSTTGCVLVPLTNSSNGTVVSAPGGVVVVLPPDDYGGPGTVVVTVSNGTNSTQSTVVTIQILNPDGTPRLIKNLSTPFRFTIPIVPGASDAVAACQGTEPVAIIPKCQWLDLVTNQWTDVGCTTSRLTSAEVECSCVHMTDFALVLPNNNRVPIQQFLELTPQNIQTYPDGLMTISLVLAVFAMLFALSACRDATDTNIYPEDSSEFSSSDKKWTDNDAELLKERDQRFCQQFKLGLQAHHTWAALLCRRPGTSFRSVDRLFVTLMMLLALMSMSANFHRRDQTLIGRTFVVASSVMASFIPSQIFAFLFSHTGEMGFLEKWQFNMGLRQPSRLKCLDYRFAAKWRYVWYTIVIAIAGMLIWFILSIALMFDQNPWYYCRGQTTQAWILDFLLQYTITVFAVEPTKIGLMVLGRKLCLSKKAKMRPSSAMLEPTYYQPLERENSIR